MRFTERETARREKVMTAVYALLGEKMAAALRDHEDFRHDIFESVNVGDITPKELHTSIKDHISIARNTLDSEAHADGFRPYLMLSDKEMNDLADTVMARIASALRAGPER